MIIPYKPFSFRQVAAPFILSKLYHHAHQLFDGMPQRTIYLLKHANSDPVNVASIHCLSLKSNSISHLPVHTSLVTAYARACNIDSSLALFRESTINDVISWNAMISAGVISSRYHVSIMIFKEMMEKNVELDPTTLVVLLSAVSCARLLKHGMVIHGIVTKKNFNSDSYLCNALISMYSKCGDWSSSENVFQTMQYRDTTSWNSIINGSHFGKFYEKSISYFIEMISCGLRPDEVSISSALSSCTSLDCSFNLGESIHGLVYKTCTCHGSVSNALVSFYSQYRDIEAAKRVFWQNDNKNVVSWNSIIKGLVENGRDIEAFQIFQDMQFNNASKPDAVTLIALIPLCGELNLPLEVKSIHGYSIRYAMQSVNSSIGNSLLDAYFSCDHESYAHKLFGNMPNRDLFSWNTMISGYAENCFFHEHAKFLFSELIRAGLRCNLPSFLGVLPSISGQEDLPFGKSIHSMVLKYGYDSSISVINALMHMYMSCGKLSVAFYLLKNIIFESDVISWNTIITGCVQKGLAREAIETFQFMHSNLNLSADFITLESILLACAALEALTWGNKIHALLLKRPIQFDVGVRKALVTMYLQVGDLKSANKVYGFGCEEKFCFMDCMILSHVQNTEGTKALELYCGNRDQFSSVNEITIVSLICACSQIADFRRGKEINGYIFRNGLQNNVYIMASLIDLYSKCGMLDLAMKIFEFSEEKSIASWNSIISAYGLHGQGEKSIRLFHKMCDLGIKPTKSTSVALLSACSQTGLVEEGLKYYNLMPQNFGLRHSVEHIVCVVDLLGRAGRVKEAYEFVNELGLCQDHGVWGALLSACYEGNGDVITGRKVAGHLFSMQQENTGYYVTLCNLFASHEMWNYVEEVRRIFRVKGLIKPKAFSVIDNLA